MLVICILNIFVILYNSTRHTSITLLLSKNRKHTKENDTVKIDRKEYNLINLSFPYKRLNY